MNKDPLIRPARNQDAPEVKRLVFDVLHSYGLQADPETTDADLNDIEGHYVTPGGCFDVLTDRNGNIVGSVGLYPMDNGHCELRKMYLHPDERGKGWGKLLLEHSLEKARALGFSTVVLETATVLKAAIRLYESYGFQPYEPEHLSCRCDQAYIKHLDD